MRTKVHDVVSIPRSVGGRSDSTKTSKILTGTCHGSPTQISPTPPISSINLGVSMRSQICWAFLEVCLQLPALSPKGSHWAEELSSWLRVLYLKLFTTNSDHLNSRALVNSSKNSVFNNSGIFSSHAKASGHEQTRAQPCFEPVHSRF